MSTLNKTEQTFLEARQQEQVDLQAQIQAAEQELAPLIEEYDSIQPQLDELYNRQREIGRLKREIIQQHNLGELKTQLSDVARDVTKLLKKQRS